MAKPGVGLVVDAETQTPIPGADVTIECRRYGYGGLLEEPGLVKTITRLTDEQGAYSVSLSDALPCDVFGVSATKQGYARGGFNDGGRPSEIPSRTFLVAFADVNIVKLKFLASLAAGSTSDSRFEYRLAYDSFVQSMKVAANLREIAFVKDHYCERLKSLYARLSESDRAYVSTLWAAYGTEKIDHRNVERYCEL